MPKIADNLTEQKADYIIDVVKKCGVSKREFPFHSGMFLSWWVNRVNIFYFTVCPRIYNQNKQMKTGGSTPVCCGSH